MRQPPFCYLCLMRHFSFFLVWWIGVFLFTACTSPEPIPGFEGAEVISYNQSDDLSLLNPNSSLSFTLNVRRNLDLNIPAIIVEQSINGEAYVEVERLLSWPVNVTYSVEDIAAQSERYNFEDFRRGDEVTLRFIPEGVENASPHLIQSRMNCPSNLTGSYQAVTVGRAGPGGGGVFDTIRYDVLIKDLGNGRYELSELTGGMYPNIWGGKPQSGILIDSCLQIIIPSQTDQWDDQLSGSGEILDAGTIRYEWNNTYGDQGTTTLLR